MVEVEPAVGAERADAHVQSLGRGLSVIEHLAIRAVPKAQSPRGSGTVASVVDTARMASWTPLRDALIVIKSCVSYSWAGLDSMVGGLPRPASVYAVFWRARAPAGRASHCPCRAAGERTN